ncbi:MAG TPA: RNA 2',3'-cyclic phosphodiesterase [Bryobacteraceae bacterium]
MRLFTGIALPEPVRDNIARVLRELRPLAPLTWSPVENLHITSKFIGEWPEERLSVLKKVLEKLDSPSGFDITIERFGWFPNPHRPHALFIGVQAGPELTALATTTEEALAQLGIPREKRPYSPHLTLARIKLEHLKQQNIRPVREHIANMTNFHFGTFPVSEFHLYLSRRSAYTPLVTYPLLAAASITTSIQA